MQNLLHHVSDLLKQDERLLSTEGDLLKNKIQELAYKLDEQLIGLLLGDDVTKTKFFVAIKDVVVFDQQKFVQFINNKEFLPDSYTAFKNKIGLTDGHGNFVNESGDVVLERPYKDGVLAGGQNKEDAKRDEIFYNEILGLDQIDRLLDPKVFTNFKKYTADGEQSVQDFNRGEDGVIKDNLIIKGNNLLALHSLKKQFAGKVKLIYIDPPYNTGNDGFKYNDKFNHSTWLTFMKNRLEVAKELLKDDGVIFVQCDDNEQAYLKVLMDEVFGFEKMINVISVKMNESKGLKNAHIEKKMPKNKEYLLVYGKNKDRFLFNPEKIEKDKDELLGYVKYYNKYIPNIDKDINDWVIEDFDKGNDIDTKLRYQDKLIYMVAPDNEVKNNGVKENHFFSITNSRGKNNVFYNNKGNILKVLFLGENTSKFLGDLWVDISTININKESGVQTLSNGQKPEKLIERIIKMSSKPGDIVLDYHLGSGTTCAVAHKMGRQYIGIEQMDYVKTIAVERMKKVIAGEQGGISKVVDRQGGGEFVYMEIAQNNLKFIHTIQNTQTSQELVSLYHQLKESSFINYKVDITSIQQGVEEFVELSLEDQKRLLIELIDKNTLYINYSEIVDRNYKISDKDKDLNNKFYQ